MFPTMLLVTLAVRSHPETASSDTCGVAPPVQLSRARAQATSWLPIFVEFEIEKCIRFLDFEFRNS